MHPLATPPMTWTDLIDPETRPVRHLGPLRGAVVSVVDAVEAMVGRRGHTGTRAVPSAGATYPYEILLAAGDHGPLALLDLARRQLVVRACDAFPLDATEYRCAVVGRPWLSMRKYGARGYLYHLIDAGHAVFDLTLVGAERATPEPEIGGPWRDRVDGAVLAVGRIAARPDTAAPARIGWRHVVTLDDHVQSGRTEFESWAEEISPRAPRRPLTFDGVRGVRAELADRVATRRSTAALTSGVAPDLLAAVLAEATECADTVLTGLGLTEPGVDRPHVTVCGRTSLTAALPSGDLLAGLGGQDHLLDADAYVVFSGPIGTDDVVHDRRQRLLLATGVVGQALYLAATRHGVAVTGIGGITPEYWNGLLRPGQQTLYLVALGRAAGQDKDDALFPGSHR